MSPVWMKWPQCVSEGLAFCTHNFADFGVLLSVPLAFGKNFSTLLKTPNPVSS